MTGIMKSVSYFDNTRGNYYLNCTTNTLDYYSIKKPTR